MHPERYAAGQAAQAEAEHRRRSIGVPVRPPLGFNALARASTTKTGRASIDQPADALKYLANKGARIQELEAELETAQAENISLNQQLQQATGSVRAHKESLASAEGERDFLTSQRSRERADIEQQLLQAEQKVLSLRQDLRHTKDAKV